MTEALHLPGFEAERRDPALSRWYSPPELAGRIWQWAWLPSVRRVLEPSAGTGNLLAPAACHPGVEVCAIEIDPVKSDALRRRFPSVGVTTCNFLDVWNDDGRERYDLVLQNPPYEDGQDVAHIEHALNFAPRVVALVLHSILFSQERREFWRRVEIRRGVRLSKRPKFGERGGERDFVVLDLARRIHDVPSSTEQWEWWT